MYVLTPGVAFTKDSACFLFQHTFHADNDPTATTDSISSRTESASLVSGLSVVTSILVVTIILLNILVVTVKIYRGYRDRFIQTYDNKNMDEGLYESLDNLNSEHFYDHIPEELAPAYAPNNAHGLADVHLFETTISINEPPCPHPHSNEGNLPPTEDTIATSPTEDVDEIPTPDHISDVCAEGVISATHNDAYGLPLPQYDEEPEYTNVRLYEATMILYFDPTDPTSTDPISTDPTSTDPTSTDPTSTDPTSTDPTSTDPTSTDPTSTDPTSTDPTSTDPTSTDPTSTDPTSTDPTSTDPNATSEPSSLHHHTSQGDLPATEDAIATSATGDAIATPDPARDACAEGVMSVTHNDAYGLPLPQYDEEPEYTNVRLYEATMRLYFDPNSASEPHSHSNRVNLSTTEDAITQTNSDSNLMGPDDHEMSEEMSGGEKIPSTDQRELAPQLVNHDSESTSTNSDLSSAAEQDGSHKLKQVRETTV